MGLPVNGKEKNCNPISSNCVIWQGPDIPCLNLCTGETVSEVVADLGKQFCDLLALFDIKNYDLTCLSNCPKVDNIQKLIQLIITNLCALQACCDDTPVPAAQNANPNINVAPCFYYVNAKGDTVTFMPLQDYAVAAGNRICTLVEQVNTLQAVAVNHTERIVALEDKPDPVFTIPDVTPVCVLPSVPTPMDQVLTALESDFCLLQNATGEANAIFQAIGKQCAGLTADRRLAPGGGVMSSITGWNNTVTNLAQSFSNMWLTICDMRAAIKNIQQNCCPTGCADVAINLSATLIGTTLRLFFTGTIPTGFVECTGTTMVTVRDTDGSSITFSLPLSTNINDPSGYPVDISVTPLNPALDFTITTNVCLTNTDIPARCESYVQYDLINSLTCPSPITLTPTTNMASPPTSEIEYSFGHPGGTLVYTIGLYDAPGTTLLQSQTASVSAPVTVNGKFSPLDPSTAYRVRVSMTAGTATASCADDSVTTPAP